MIVINNVNPNKLHDELINAGITPKSVKHNKVENEDIAEKTWITFEEGTNMAMVQKIIDAHDTTPLPPPKTKLEILQETVDVLVLDNLEVL